jgi:CheY-like chemotaxis protein
MIQKQLMEKNYRGQISRVWRFKPEDERMRPHPLLLPLYLCGSMYILIIEDDKMTLEALSRTLQDLGHSPVQAENGNAALDLIGKQTFDLVISDIMMPGTSGLSLVNDIRSLKGISTPVVMMSSIRHQPLLEAAFAAGANGFIGKPLLTGELKELINKFDKKKEDGTERK